MTLLAGWKLLLARQAGQDDVVVGTPVANRTRTEAEGLIGFFVNTLALRTDLSGAPAFRELLARVRETTLGAYAHQDLPFEQVLEAVRPERSLSYAPVFQVFFNLLGFDEAELRLPGLVIEPVARDAEEQAKFDLTLYVRTGPEGIGLSMLYDADLFGPARAAEMLEQFRLVLEQAVADPGASVASYSLVTAAAREHLPDPRGPLGAEWLGSVPALFAAHAARAPERLAVEDEHGSWSYGELDRRSAQLAHALLAGGVRPGEVVAVYAHRSAPVVWALLGILRAGAAFVVLDPAYPPLRLASYLRIARPTGWLRIAAAGEPPAAVEEAAADTARCSLVLPGLGAAAGGPLDGFPAHDPEVRVGPDSLAYLSFTSGTTGTPKAVMGRHGSLTHFLPWLRDTFALQADDRFTLLSGLGHDPLQRDVFTPLQLGAAVCIPPAAAFEAQGGLARWMREAGVTVAHLTPAMGKLVTDVPPEREGERVDTLRRVFLVGEALTRADVARLQGLAPMVRVVNYYGSTETQRAVGYFPVPDDFVGSTAKEIVPLGRGIRDVQLLVLNAAGALAGVGEVGEIHLRSPHVALGYLDDPELTAERFLANPFGESPGDRVYRTGDLGRYRPDGVVEPLGRADGQVKVRGFRIELGEIEATLAEHPAVREAVVTVREDAPGDRRLAGYVVPGEEGFDPAELRRHLRERLPEYMVPATFTALAALPLTPNGKTDRRALPAPDDASAAAAEGEAPRTPVEEVVAAVWERVLGVERVARTDDFFEIGGHSLLATRVASHVREALGAEVPVRALFEAPTLAAFAAYVEARRGRAGAAPAPIARVAEPGRPLPLSFAQQRLWLVHQIDPESRVYNQGLAVRLRGRLDAAVLRRALGEIVRRHAVLRTRFEETDAGPVQVVEPPFPLALPVADLSGVEDPRAAQRDAVRSEVQRLFDLRSGRLLRAMLLRVAAEEHVLVLVVHHIAIDGWSRGGDGPRAGGAVPGLRGGAPVAAPGAAGAVRRLRGVAARLAHPGARAGAAGLLARPAGRLRRAPPGHRPRPRLGRHRRRPAGLPAFPGGDGGGAAGRPRAGSDPLHGAPGRLPGAPAPPGRGGRGGGGGPTSPTATCARKRKG
jgi:amino acid adenylation domain-containing protein